MTRAIVRRSEEAKWLAGFDPQAGREAPERVALEAVHETISRGGDAQLETLVRRVQHARVKPEASTAEPPTIAPRSGRQRPRFCTFAAAGAAAASRPRARARAADMPASGRTRSLPSRPIRRASRIARPAARRKCRVPHKERWPPAQMPDGHPSGRRVSLDRRWQLNGPPRGCGSLFPTPDRRRELQPLERKRRAVYDDAVEVRHVVVRMLVPARAAGADCV